MVENIDTQRDGMGYHELALKVRSRVLDEDTAWQVFSEYSSFPGGLRADVLKDVFILRRSAFFEEIPNAEASGKIIEIYQQLSPTEQTMMEESIVAIRNIFTRAPHHKKSRRF